MVAILNASSNRRLVVGAAMAAFLVSTLLAGCSPDASRSAAGDEEDFQMGQIDGELQDSAEDSALTAEQAATVPPPGTCSDGSTWMSCMFPNGDRTIASLVMPGSHDTGTYSISADSPFVSSCAAMPRIVYSLAAGVVAKWAKTQTQSLGAQLRAGARYFDVRPAWVNNEWVTCHTLAGASMEEITGRNSELQQFLRDHPNEVVLIDLSHVYGGDASNREALKSLIKTNLGEFTYLAQPDRTLASTTLADVRNSGANVIVFGVKSVESELIWPREPNLYTPWVDDSEPAKLFWNNRFGEAQLALNLRESASLLNEKSLNRLTVLNYIWDSNCPLGDATCVPKYVAPGSLISWTQQYLTDSVPEFTRAMKATAKKVPGRGYVVMRDIVTTGSNQPIWEANR